MNILRRFLVFVCLICIVINLASQEKKNGLDKFVDFFTFHPNKRSVEKDSSLYPSKIITAPIIYYSPETSLGFGLGSKSTRTIPTLAKISLTHLASRNVVAKIAT